MFDIREENFRIVYENLTTPQSLSALPEMLSADYTLVWIQSGYWNASLMGSDMILKKSTILFKRADEELLLSPCDSEGENGIFVLAVWGQVPRKGCYAPICDDLYNVLDQKPAGAYNICPHHKVRQHNLGLPLWTLLTMDHNDFEKKVKRELSIQVVYSILVNIRRMLPDAAAESDLSRIAQIRYYIDEHITEDLSARKLANIFYITPNYLSSIFKNEVGTNLHQYIVEQRIKLANDLLLQGIPGTDVAMKVGYKSYQGFYQAYQSVMNMSPTEFLEKQI